MFIVCGGLTDGAGLEAVVRAWIRTSNAVSSQVSSTLTSTDTTELKIRQLISDLSKMQYTSKVNVVLMYCGYQYVSSACIHNYRLGTGVGGRAQEHAPPPNFSALLYIII